jgi:hypothetical protein
MNRSRRAAIPIVLAALVVSALFASSASATTPVWIIEGAHLEKNATQALAKTTNVTETFSIKLSVAGTPIKIGCTGMALPQSLIKGESTREDNSFEMTSCTFTGPASCSMPASFKLQPLTSTLEGTAGAFKLKFAPTAGTTAMKIPITGEKCAIAGKLEVTGTMSCNYPGVETEAVNHVLEFSLTSGTELKFGSSEVTLTGKDEFWLANSKKWKVE